MAIHEGDDDAAADMRRVQGLRLIKAFLQLNDAGKRQRVLQFVERLADEAASDAASLAAAEPPTSGALSPD